MRRLKKIRKPRPTFAFVVDGETEAWYLLMLKRNESRLRNLIINIEPILPQRKKISDQYELVKKLSKSEYSKVFWIVDLDTLIEESRKTPKGKNTSMQTFIKYRNEIQKNYKNVVVIINNPCLEFWFLLHFENTSKSFDKCNKVVHELKKYLVDYEKTQIFFTKQDNDIYLKLKPYLHKAILNSKSLGVFDSKDPNKSISEMFILFDTNELKTVLSTQKSH